MFPSTYEAIREMIRTGLLETTTARDIARKAGIRLSSSLPGANIPDIWGTFSLRPEGADIGYTVEHTSGTYSFPDGTVSMNRYADMTGTTSARLLVTVTEAGIEGSTLKVTLSGASFTDGQPEVDLGAVGLHITEWKPLIHSLGPDEGALVQWVVTSEASEGSFSVGLCQLQMR